MPSWCVLRKVSDGITRMRSRPANYDYNRLGDESAAAEMVELQSPRDEMKLKTFPPHYGLIRSEKTAGHTACMNYLKNSNGRYVLLDQLPEIGWRTNRLWYVICDARVNAKRLLIATPCNSRSPVIDATTKNIMIQVCRALQHPYVCPVLDLETVTVENFDRPFSLVVTPVAPRGSLRDVFHKSQWADHWPNKYCRRGCGLSEGHAQRLSCHILEAMLELRLRGLPAGIGGHLHPGNVLIQHGTARFSGLDNVLMGHNPRALPFISRYINTNLEAIDSISFAYILFAMCAGYEVVTAKLTPQNWNDIRDYVQASQVLEYILENPESRVPTLKEISNLDFYRTIDLRELRSLPLPHVMAGPPVPPVTVLLEHLYSKKLQKGKKSRSTSEVCDTEKSSACPFPGPPFESSRPCQTFHTYKKFSVDPRYGSLVPKDNVDTIEMSACVIKGVSRSRNVIIDGVPPRLL
ncbi:unnamed protein product [Allacma fusca]|uniref:Slowpoke binding protein n=1 Tax=Allacma fusca TaxID=39272 RepID=A0A8J2KJ44_9HEXA|nr:unnamed protein product [Allacma fusca]